MCDFKSLPSLLFYFIDTCVLASDWSFIRSTCVIYHHYNMRLASLFIVDIDWLLFWTIIDMDIIMTIFVFYVLCPCIWQWVRSQFIRLFVRLGHIRTSISLTISFPFMYPNVSFIHKCFRYPIIWFLVFLLSNRILYFWFMLIFDACHVFIWRELCLQIKLILQVKLILWVKLILYPLCYRYTVSMTWVFLLFLVV